jgi:PAS domain S-box-containing protein/diguanylate cyclase (GGDEF)-like protein
VGVPSPGQGDPMTDVTAALQSLAEDVVTLLGAGAVAVRRLDADGEVETLVLAGPNAAALRAENSEPIARLRGRWRRREHGGPGEQETHPIAGPTGQQHGWVVLERGPSAQGRAAESTLRVLLGYAGALLENAELAARQSAQSETLLECSQDLREMTGALRVAFEESVVGMAMISLDPAEVGRYLRVNDALCRLTGYTREELMARPFEELTHPEDRGLTASAMRRAMAGRRTPFRTEKRFLRSDGSVCWVRVTAAPLFDDEDRPLYAIGQVEDLSQRGDREAELALRLDPLTGLLNSAALEESLVETVQRAHRTGTGCAVLFAELDGWDELLAAQAGGDDADLADQLQLALGRRLRTTLRGGDVVSRVGDNQFVIITEEVGTDQVEAVARRLEQALAVPELVGGRELALTANLGLSVLTEAPGDDAAQSATLLTQAKAALARARSTGGGSHVLYASKAEPAASQSRTLYVHPDWQVRPK